jgi:hypothetical protein
VVFWTNWAGTELGHATVVEASSAEVNKDKVESMLTDCPSNAKRLGRLGSATARAPSYILSTSSVFIVDPSFFLTSLVIYCMVSLTRSTLILPVCCLCQHTPDIGCALYINGSIFGPVRTSIQILPRNHPATIPVSWSSTDHGTVCIMAIDLMPLGACHECNDV